jgi:hypothetical protein
LGDGCRIAVMGAAAAVGNGVVMGTPAVRMAVAACVGALLSLLPWGTGALVRAMLPDRDQADCGEFAFLCLPHWGGGLVDLLIRGLVPGILATLVGLVIGLVLLHTLKVRPAAPVAGLGVVLAMVVSFLTRLDLPVAAVIWAVCYLVAEVTVSAVRARRKSPR